MPSKRRHTHLLLLLAACSTLFLLGILRMAMKLADFTSTNNEDHASPATMLRSRLEAFRDVNEISSSSSLHQQDGGTVAQEEGDDDKDDDKDDDDADNDPPPSKLKAPLHFPPLPPHQQAVDLFGPHIIHDTLLHNPSIPGIIAIFQSFLTAVHDMLTRNKDADASTVIFDYFSLVQTILRPLEDRYRHRPMFDIREDDSIYMSLGSYRDHLLGETLKQAYRNARNPEKLFVGAVVQ